MQIYTTVKDLEVQIEMREHCLMCGVMHDTWKNWVPFWKKNPKLLLETRTFEQQRLKEQKDLIVFIEQAQSICRGGQKSWKCKTKNLGRFICLFHLDFSLEEERKAAKRTREWTKSPCQHRSQWCRVTPSYSSRGSLRVEELIGSMEAVRGFGWVASWINLYFIHSSACNNRSFWNGEEHLSGTGRQCWIFGAMF